MAATSIDKSTLARLSGQREAENELSARFAARAAISF
jgi:hypothetical protein